MLLCTDGNLTRALIAGTDRGLLPAGLMVAFVTPSWILLAYTAHFIHSVQTLSMLAVMKIDAALVPMVVLNDPLSISQRVQEEVQHRGALGRHSLEHLVGQHPS